MGDKFIYVKRSGRETNRIVPNLFSISRSRVRKAKMPIMNDDNRQPQETRNPNGSSTNQNYEAILQAEIERLRIQLENAQRQLVAAQAVAPAAQNLIHDPVPQQGTTIISNSEMCNLIGGLNFANLDIKIPKFIDENTCNPKEFLEDWEKFFRVKPCRSC